jgi:ATP-binding cassette, subfamily F, member 3
VANGRVRPYEGDLDDYRRLLLAAARPQDRGRSGPSRRQQAAEQRARLLDLRREARAAERALETLTADHGRLAARLSDGATYDLPGPELEALIRREAELKAALEAAGQRWLEAEDALERAQG